VRKLRIFPFFMVPPSNFPVSAPGTAVNDTRLARTHAIIAAGIGEDAHCVILKTMKPFPPRVSLLYVRGHPTCI
jgi:hypothetical protein